MIETRLSIRGDLQGTNLAVGAKLKKNANIAGEAAVVVAAFTTFIEPEGLETFYFCFYISTSIFTPLCLLPQTPNLSI